MGRSLQIHTALAGADAMLASLYPHQQPFVHTAPRRWRDGGSEPLSGVGVFAHPAGHFHYVSFGLSDADHRLACELSFRLARREREEQPPRWPIELLNAVALHALRNPRSFHEGYYHCLERAFGADARVRCAALIPDPELHRPNAERLQVVSLTERELRAISEAFDPIVLADRAPLFVTSR